MGHLIPATFSDDGESRLAFEEVIDEALKALPKKSPLGKKKLGPGAKLVKSKKGPIGSLAAYEIASEEDPWADTLTPANLQRLERLRKALGIRDIAVFSTIDGDAKKPTGKPKGTTFFLLDTQENLLALLDGPETKAAVRSLLAVPVKEQPKFAVDQRITWRELSRLLSMCFNAAEYADEDLPWFRFFPLPDPGSLEYYWYSIARGVWVKPAVAPVFELCRTDDILEFGSSDGPSLIVPRGNPGLPAVFISHGVSFDALERIRECGSFLWPSLAFTWKVPPAFGQVVFLFDVRALADLLDPDASPDPRVVFAPTDIYTPSVDAIHHYQESVNKELRGDPVYWKGGTHFETSFYRPLDAKQFLSQGYPEDHRIGNAPSLALSQERITTWKSLEMHLWKCLETHTKLPGGLFGYTHTGSDQTYGEFPYFELKIFASVPVSCATALIIPKSTGKSTRKEIDRFIAATGFQGKVIEAPDAPLVSSDLPAHLKAQYVDQPAAWATGMTTKLLESPCDLSWIFWPRKGESLHECEIHEAPPTPKKKGQGPKKIAGKKSSAHHAEMLSVSEHALSHSPTAAIETSIQEHRDDVFKRHTTAFRKGWTTQAGLTFSVFVKQPYGAPYYHMTYGRLLMQAARVSPKTQFLDALIGVPGLKRSDILAFWDHAQIREGLHYTASFKHSGKTLVVKAFEGSFPDIVGDLECTRLDSKEKWKFCADDIHALANGQDYPVWETSVSGINPDWMGQGAGSELYRYAIQVLFAHEGPFFLVPNLCRNNYSTSDMAQAVWKRLHRDYPQHGEWAILVEDPAPDLHRDPLVQRFDREARTAIARTDTRGQLVLRESLPVRRRPSSSAEEHLEDSSAMPRLYHGTTIEGARGILKDGHLNARETRGMSYQAPLPGRVYLTRDLGYVLTYALSGLVQYNSENNAWDIYGRNDEGAVVVVEVPLSACIPDEDWLGQKLINYVLRPNEWFKANRPIPPQAQRLLERAFQSMPARTIEGWRNQGARITDATRESRTGKTAINNLLKTAAGRNLLAALAAYSPHLACESAEVRPVSAWEIHKDQVPELHPDGSNFEHVAREITPSRTERLPARPRFGRLTANSVTPEFPWEEDTRNVFTLDGASITYTPEVMPPEVYIGVMHVPPGRRGQGLGRRLITLLLAEIDRRGLASRLIAHPQDSDTFGDQLIAFYEDLGFEIVRGEGRPGKPVMRRPAHFDL